MLRSRFCLHERSTLRWCFYARVFAFTRLRPMTENQRWHDNRDGTAAAKLSAGARRDGGVSQSGTEGSGCVRLSCLGSNGASFELCRVIWSPSSKFVEEDPLAGRLLLETLPKQLLPSRRWCRCLRRKTWRSRADPRRVDRHARGQGRRLLPQSRSPRAQSRAVLSPRGGEGTEPPLDHSSAAFSFS